MDLLSATQPLRDRPAFGYAFGLISVALAIAVCFALGPMAARFPFVIFLPPVVLTTLLGGIRPGVLAAVLGGLAADYLLITPGGFVLAWPAGYVAMGFYTLTVSIDIAIIHGMTSAFTRAGRAERELTILNAELERRVADRTAALEAEMADRQAAEAQVRQMQKMEAVGQLTGGIAHDFNNMLAVVIGSIDMARRRHDRPERLAQCLDNAEEGARRAAQLTARLLAFSRQQPLEPQVVDANKLVAGMSELMRRTIGEQVRVETVLAGGLWRTFADAAQIENAILNLAVNGRDAMPDGGRLTIETANVDLDDRYAQMHEDVSPGQYVMVSVTDNGTGMPQQVVERAFDPFYTTKGVGKGTGLGLSQVFGFVKQSGGHVKIYSEVGEGTTIKLYLPRRFGEESDTASLAATEADAIPHGSEHEIVLVVEDEAQVRHMSVDALRELGYTVIQASDANQAIELLRIQPRIDLLFTDIVMPEMNGRQLADIARTIRRDLLVIYTTGYTRNAVVHNGMLDPGLAFLPKPFTIRQLAIKLRQTLDGPHGGEGPMDSN